MSKGFFCVVTGTRLGGKTTAAGTLPGKTVLLQATVLESGSRSAQALAKKRGNELQVEDFTDRVNLFSQLDKWTADPTVKHIYIDGFSAINDIRFGEHDIQKEFKKNQLAAYALHGHDMTELVKAVKAYTASGKNIFITCAVLKKDSGDVKLEAKGQMAVTAITKLGEAVVTIKEVPSEEGEKRVILTKTWDGWPGRIDGVLDDENPGYVYPVDLGKVLELAQGVA